jgi:hypothetical protein
MQLSFVIESLLSIISNIDKDIIKSRLHLLKLLNNIKKSNIDDLYKEISYVIHIRLSSSYTHRVYEKLNKQVLFECVNSLIIYDHLINHNNLGDLKLLPLDMRMNIMNHIIL